MFDVTPHSASMSRNPNQFPESGGWSTRLWRKGPRTLSVADAGAANIAKGIKARSRGRRKARTDTAARFSDRPAEVNRRRKRLQHLCFGKVREAEHQTRRAGRFIVTDSLRDRASVAGEHGMEERMGLGDAVVGAEASQAPMERLGGLGNDRVQLD